MKNFNKNPLTITEQIELLESRGLVFTDKNTAKQHLERTSYYRLSGYMIPYYDRTTETFLQWTKFKDITETYFFDGDLKLLLMEALELIEVDFKTKIINLLSIKYKTGHRFLDEMAFTTEAAYKNSQKTIQDRVEKSKDTVFIKHYNEEYWDPVLPPSWMIFQILPFGENTGIYQALTKPNKILIAKQYNLRPFQFESRMLCMSYLRNLCAHSDRVWNRRMTRKVNIKWWDNYFQWDRDSLFSYLIVICYLLRIIVPWCSRFSKLEKLIDNHKSIPLVKMGFPNNWKKIIGEKKFVIKDF
jgi:Abortive infection bacteriophage resistance protein